MYLKLIECDVTPRRKIWICDQIKTKRNLVRIFPTPNYLLIVIIFWCCWNWTDLLVTRNPTYSTTYWRPEVTQYTQEVVKLCMEVETGENWWPKSRHLPLPLPPSNEHERVAQPAAALIIIESMSKDAISITTKTSASQPDQWFLLKYASFLKETNSNDVWSNSRLPELYQWTPRIVLAICYSAGEPSASCWKQFSSSPCKISI